MQLDISPEEILKNKEMQGGLIYDEEIISETPKSDLIETTQDIKESIVLDPEIISVPKVESSLPPSFELGWKNIPLHILPSRGIFYPEGTRMAIYPAEVNEIRHYSTIDEEDRLGVEEKLGYILERCLKIDFPNAGIVSYKHLKQEDRFFVIMAIRDLSFVVGENVILLTPNKKCKDTDECPFSNGIELRTGALDFYELDKKVLKYYNPKTRSFVFNVKKINKSIEMFIPSVGINQAITNFMVYANNNSIEVDEGFIKIAPFLFDDWQKVTNTSILLAFRESDNWTKEEYSLYFELSEIIKIGTKLGIKQRCPVCDEEVTADIAFPFGLRSLFVISDIFGQLL
jgi:hypothetical protein